MSLKIVAKFGGSSVKDASAIKRVAKIIFQSKPSLVVLSATYNTTNELENLAQATEDKKDELCIDLQEKHLRIADDLGVLKSSKGLIAQLISKARTLSLNINPESMDELYSIGERLSSQILYEYLKSQNHDCEFIDARNLIKTDETYTHAEPDIGKITQSCEEFHSLFGNRLIVTQGFIGQSPEGKTTTLGREGSDYTAALLAEGFGADQVIIWTDVEGVATFDPRICNEAKFIEKMSYEQAAILANNGAKVLFPRTMAPVERIGIPLYVRSTFKPELVGTCISEQKCDKQVHVGMAFENNVATIVSNDLDSLANSLVAWKVIEKGRGYIKISCEPSDIPSIHNLIGQF